MSTGLWIGTLAASGVRDGDFESIATVTVGSGGASAIDFNSIPSTYQHLQLRFIGRRTTAATDGWTPILRFNGANEPDTFRSHRLFGDGASASAGESGSVNAAYLWNLSSSSHNTSVFGAGIIDILDYASTTKTTVIRGFAGFDNNSSSPAGRVNIFSGLYFATTAISAINVVGSTFAEHSTFALYGIKAP